MDEQQYKILRKDDPLSWALMPKAIDRIKRFCVKYQTDTEPEELAKYIQQSFVLDDPSILVAIAFQKGLGVFAHALACIEEVTGKRFLIIMQMETDIPFEDRVGVNEMLRKFKVWGLNHNAGEARVITSDKAHERLFRKLYGFEPHRILMRKALMEV